MIILLCYIDFPEERYGMIKYTFESFRPNHSYASIINSSAQLRTEHTHDFYEISLVRSGACIHHINKVEQSLQVGCMSFIRPSDVHYYKPLTSTFSIINVLISSSTIDALFDYLGNGFEPDRLLDRESVPMTVLSYTDFRAVQNELEKLILYQKLLGNKAEAMFNITLMKMITTNFPIALTHKHTDIPSWLSMLLLEMLKEENFTQGIEAMHRLCGKTPEHLSRSCKKFIGMPPSQFLNKIRLHHAAVLLVTTEKKIIEICHESGFNNLSHFYHSFEKVYGVSPLKYRNMQDTSQLDGYGIASVMLPAPIPLAPPPPAQ